ncbi:MAG: hypothetical protein DCF22_23410 [Leptolyngbya sp.]|nr:MAG: hypothetical protein DCF22_23410 [Leptolyngbya sp.]
MTQTAAQRKDQRKRKFRVWKSKEKQADTDKPQEPKDQQGDEEERGGWSLLLLIYCFLLGSLVALALFWNVQPFITFIKVIATKVDFAEISRFLFSLPGIGGFFLWVANFYAALLGSMLYAIFQVIELTPYFYRRNPVRMRQTIAAWKNWATFKVTRHDPRAVRSLKRSYNEHPLKLYKNLSTARNVVYAFELVVCFIAEPPVKDGNPFTFLGYLITLQFGKIDWLNVLLMLSVLFLVDGLVRFTLAVVPEIFPKTEA